MSLTPRDAFVTDSRTNAAGTSYTLRYKGDDQQAHDATYAAKGDDEIALLEHALGSTSTVPIAFDGDEVLLDV